MEIGPGKDARKKFQVRRGASIKIMIMRIGCFAFYGLTITCLYDDREQEYLVMVQFQ